MQMHLAAILPRLVIPISQNAGKNRPGKRASALLATLCFAGVLSLSVSGYLAVCYRSLVVSNRELISSHCMELAEMGMDETLWAKNNGAFDSSWVVSGGVATKTVSDPEFPSHPPYPDTSSVPFQYDNGAKGVVMLKYDTTNNQATAVGVVTLADGTIIRRGLWAVVRPAQLFTNAIGATGSLQFTAGGTVNSYTAVDPTNFGTYTWGTSAVISGINVDLGNAAIYGFAATRGTTLQNLTNAIVSGSFSGTDIDASRVSSNGAQPLFSTLSATGLVDQRDPITDSSQLTNSDTLTAGNYHYDSILLDGSKELRITGDVVLKVTNYVYIGAGSQIHVTTNSTLRLQIDSTGYDSDVRLANAYSLPQGLYMVAGGIVNDSQQPHNVTIQIGSTIATDSSPHSYSFFDTSVPFFGSIYLPNDTIDIVNNDFTLYGAIVGKNINFSGTNPTIHFDSTLYQTNLWTPPGVNLPFALYQLRELTPAEIATL